MGRRSTGAMNTAQVCRIDMRYLTRWGVFKHQECSFPMSWNDGSSIRLTLINNFEETCLIFNYTLTDRADIKHELNYKVYIEKVLSNLGRGFVYYFICPNTGNRCRILYRAYGSHTFRSRKGFSYRLYYPLQQGSKLGLIFDRKFSAEEKYLKLSEGRKRNQHYFKGKITKFEMKKESYFKRYMDLEEESDRFFSWHWSKKFRNIPL